MRVKTIVDEDFTNYKSQRCSLERFLVAVNAVLKQVSRCRSVKMMGGVQAPHQY